MKIDKKNILVTGGAGFIGSHIARTLLEKGCNVSIIDNLSIGKRENVPDGVRFIQGDILDEHTVDQVMSGIEVVYHEAARVSIRLSMDRFVEDAQTNVIGTLNVLRSAARHNVGRFVFASSMAVYSDAELPETIDEGARKEPISPYGIGKLASEQYCLTICRQAGIRPVILRYFNTYGPGQTLTPYVGVINIFINRLLSNESPVVFGAGTQVRDFVHVGDIVQANLKALEYDGNETIFNIGSGVPHTVNDIATLLVEKMRRRVPVVHEAEQPGEIKNSLAGISRARTELGFSPTGSLDEKIDEVIAWCSRESNA